MSRLGQSMMWLLLSYFCPLYHHFNINQVYQVINRIVIIHSLPSSISGPLCFPFYLANAFSIYPSLTYYKTLVHLLWHLAYFLLFFLQIAWAPSCCSLLEHLFSITHSLIFAYLGTNIDIIVFWILLGYLLIKYGAKSFQVQHLNQSGLRNCLLLFYFHKCITNELFHLCNQLNFGINFGFCSRIDLYEWFLVLSDLLIARCVSTLIQLLAFHFSISVSFHHSFAFFTCFDSFYSFYIILICLILNINTYIYRFCPLIIKTDTISITKVPHYYFIFPNLWIW